MTELTPVAGPEPQASEERRRRLPRWLRFMLGNQLVLVGSLLTAAMILLSHVSAIGPTAAPYDPSRSTTGSGCSHRAKLIGSARTNSVATSCPGCSTVPGVSGMVGVLTVILTTLLGTALGLVAGCYRWLDSEAVLSFIGAGVPAPQASWGNMLADSRQYMHQAPSLTYFPGIANSFFVLGLILLGDGLRDYLDPRCLT